MDKQISIEDFQNIDIHIGTIVSVEINKKAKKPAYILEIDFGKLGMKTSSAQLTENYTKELLIGKQISAVTNFPAMRVAGVKSEVLVLAVVCEDEKTVLLEPTKLVKNGGKVS